MRELCGALFYYLYMSNIRQQIIDEIYSNNDQDITGDILQRVLLAMFDRDVFLTNEEYEYLVAHGQVDEDKIYHIFES